MKPLIYILFLLLGTQVSLAQNQSLSLDDKLEIAKNRCAPRVESESYFYMDMFRGSHSPEGIDALYTTVYNQDSRLYRRAGYDKSSNTFITQGDKVSVRLPEKYLKSVILHVENTLRLNYVKHIFFPDMGHSHLLIPIKQYNQMQDIKTGPMPDALNLYLELDELKSLYHTAEKYQFKIAGAPIDDWYVQWRFYTRNPVIDKDGNIELLTNKKSSANTVSSVEGYHWSAGIALSANKNGCFPFEDAEGEIQYFDISAWDPIHKCADEGFCGDF